MNNIKNKNSNNLPLMPKATAVWLIDNSSLSFRQIAEFCGMHILEVKSIADGEIAKNIIGYNPIVNEQISIDNLKECEKNHDINLTLLTSNSNITKSQTKNRKYVPIVKRQDKPDAIMWLLENIEGISDGAIIRLIGTTKNTINAIREKTHWNIAKIRSKDPVFLGFCKQEEIEKTKQRVAKQKLKDSSEQ
ncbi:MAG TPA: DUF1013 domain-containing protein [Candidatus Megaira endosymbiont of Hartmannula sinica]|nr:DUF1013 domain-containing protein [Candidatus Megaera endosymbiont of Hartmannula sinica]